MPTIHHVENFIYWLTGEGKLVEILNSGSEEIPVIAESLDEYHCVAPTEPGLTSRLSSVAIALGSSHE